MNNTEKTIKKQENSFNSLTEQLSKVKDLTNDLEELEYNLSAISVLLGDKLESLQRGVIKKYDLPVMLERELPLTLYLSNELYTKRNELRKLLDELLKIVR